MIKDLLRTILGQFPGVLHIYRHLRDQVDQNQHSIKTPWGFTLAGHPAMARGEFEPEETRIFLELLKELDVLVNVGANVGYYCCHALNMGKRVIALEPNMRNLYYLLRNIDENGWSRRAEVFPVALGAANDVLQMWGGGLALH